MGVDRELCLNVRGEIFSLVSLKLLVLDESFICFEGMSRAEDCNYSMSAVCEIVVL